jgi:uncharacterized protein YceK
MLKSTTIVVVTATLVTLLGLTGCGTIETTSYGVLEPYAGIDLDAYIIGNTDSTFERLIRIPDLPLSLVGDTALLPITFLISGEEIE